MGRDALASIDRPLAVVTNRHSLGFIAGHEDVIDERGT